MTGGRREASLAALVASVAALPAAGGTVAYYTWDALDDAAHVRALARAARTRRLVVLPAYHHGNGHWSARLVPLGQAPVRTCAGQKGRRKRRLARARRLRCERLEQAYTYRDRLAVRVGWAAAVADPTYRALLAVGRERRRAVGGGT